MNVSEAQFPWLMRERDAQLGRDLERRRVIAERLAEEREARAREAGEGYSDAAGRRSIRQLLPTRFAHRARPAM